MMHFISSDRRHQIFVRSISSLLTFAVHFNAYFVCSVFHR